MRGRTSLRPQNSFPTSIPDCIKPPAIPGEQPLHEIRIFPFFSTIILATSTISTPEMPFRNWHEKRGSIFILAAASITILLFTVVHLRHFLPRRHRVHVQDCNSFYVSDLVRCLKGGAEEGSGEMIAGKEWL